MQNYKLFFLIIILLFPLILFIIYNKNNKNTSNIVINNFVEHWTDNKNNPVLTPSFTEYDWGAISQPKVIYFNNKYIMYYVGTVNHGVKYILYAESKDGINWVKPLEQPILYPGESGSWDSWAVHPGAVIVDNDTIKMFYCSGDDQSGKWNVGYAYSTDGINWTKRDKPVLYGGDDWDFQMVASSVIKVNNLYYLFYYGRGSENFKIGLATSSNGINWTKHQSNPIINVSENWENLGLSSPSVIYENGIFMMVYGNVGALANNAVGYAESKDGINWVKSVNNPFFDITQTYEDWASVDIAYPHLIKFKNEYRVYYSGLSKKIGVYNIGFVRKVE